LVKIAGDLFGRQSNVPNKQADGNGGGGRGNRIKRILCTISRTGIDVYMAEWKPGVAKKKGTAIEERPMACSFQKTQEKRLGSNEEGFPERLKQKGEVLKLLPTCGGSKERGKEEKRVLIYSKCTYRPQILGHQHRQENHETKG